ncbi:MAG TPA: hypothetical protein VD788_07135 [Candidatus Polarisedimenticolaceae bacterium]|nr:hypothetical protein [Candidatus Polarisedimenticolaceae bacterium]
MRIRLLVQAATTVVCLQGVVIPAESPALQGRYFFSDATVADDRVTVTLNLWLRNPVRSSIDGVSLTLHATNGDETLATHAPVSFADGEVLPFRWPVEIPAAEYELWRQGARPKVEFVDPSEGESAASRPVDLAFDIFELPPPEIDESDAVDPSRIPTQREN